MERWTEVGRPHYVRAVDGLRRPDRVGDCRLPSSWRQPCASLAKGAIDAYGALVSGGHPGRLNSEALFTSFAYKALRSSGARTRRRPPFCSDSTASPSGRKGSVRSGPMGRGVGGIGRPPEGHRGPHSLAAQLRDRPENAGRRGGRTIGRSGSAASRRTWR